MENSLLLTRLEKVLGRSTKTARTNRAFYCPFCKHPKKKLEIDLDTDASGENRWACWVCSTRGRTIRSLVRKLEVSEQDKAGILSLVKKNYNSKTSLVFTEEVKLPEGFKPLSSASSDSFLANKFKKYLLNRGVSEDQIYSYNIGYCTGGDYENRIIIPSYDKNNKLNFFIGRGVDDKTFPKYKNPGGERNLIFFENRINWNLPIILVEGVFDALSVRRNVIPILGTNVPSILMRTLVEKQVQRVYIALDRDALGKALSLSMKVSSIVPEVYLLQLEDQDPSDTGFAKFHEIKDTTQVLDDSTVLKLKLQ